MGNPASLTWRFDRSVAILRDQFPDDLSEEDWNTLANVLLAYIWNDRFKGDLKQVEQDFLANKSVEFKQIATSLLCQSEMRRRAAPCNLEG